MGNVDKTAGWRRRVVWIAAAAASLTMLWLALHPSHPASVGATNEAVETAAVSMPPGSSGPPASLAAATPASPDSSTPGSPDSTAAASSGSPAPLAAPSAGTSSAPALPGSPGSVLLLLRKPEATLSLAALTWRGAGPDNQLVNDLKAPMNAFRASDFARAGSDFTALQAKYPESVEPFYYGGVSQLFLNDPTRAAASLERAAAVADSVFAPRVAWYRAVAATRLGHIANARALLDGLCRENGDYAAQACAALPSFDEGR